MAASSSADATMEEVGDLRYEQGDEEELDDATRAAILATLEDSDDDAGNDTTGGALDARERELKRLAALEAKRGTTGEEKLVEKSTRVEWRAAWHAHNTIPAPLVRAHVRDANGALLLDANQRLVREPDIAKWLEMDEDALLMAYDMTPYELVVGMDTGIARWRLHRAQFDTGTAACHALQKEFDLTERLYGLPYALGTKPEGGNMWHTRRFFAGPCWRAQWELMYGYMSFESLRSNFWVDPFKLLGVVKKEKEEAEDALSRRLRDESAARLALAKERYEKEIEANGERVWLGKIYARLTSDLSQTDDDCGWHTRYYHSFFDLTRDVYAVFMNAMLFYPHRGATHDKVYYYQAKTLMLHFARRFSMLRFEEYQISYDVLISRWNPYVVGRPEEMTTQTSLRIDQTREEGEASDGNLGQPPPLDFDRMHTPAYLYALGNFSNKFDPLIYNMPAKRVREGGGSGRVLRGDVDRFSEARAVVESNRVVFEEDWTEFVTRASQRDDRGQFVPLDDEELSPEERAFLAAYRDQSNWEQIIQWCFTSTDGKDFIAARGYDVELLRREVLVPAPPQGRPYMIKPRYAMTRTQRAQHLLTEIMAFPPAEFFRTESHVPDPSVLPPNVASVVVRALEAAHTAYDLGASRSANPERLWLLEVQRRLDEGEYGIRDPLFYMGLDLKRVFGNAIEWHQRADAQEMGDSAFRMLLLPTQYSEMSHGKMVDFAELCMRVFIEGWESREPDDQRRKERRLGWEGVLKVRSTATEQRKLYTDNRFYDNWFLDGRPPSLLMPGRVTMLRRLADMARDSTGEPLSGNYTRPGKTLKRIKQTVDPMSQEWSDMSSEQHTEALRTEKFDQMEWVGAVRQRNAVLMAKTLDLLSPDARARVGQYIYNRFGREKSTQYVNTEMNAFVIDCGELDWEDLSEAFYARGYTDRTTLQFIDHTPIMDNLRGSMPRLSDAAVTRMQLWSDQANARLAQEEAETLRGRIGMEFAAAITDILGAAEEVIAPTPGAALSYMSASGTTDDSELRGLIMVHQAMNVSGPTPMPDFDSDAIERKVDGMLSEARRREWTEEEFKGLKESFKANKEKRLWFQGGVEGDREYAAAISDLTKDLRELPPTSYTERGRVVSEWIVTHQYRRQVRQLRVNQTDDMLDEVYQAVDIATAADERTELYETLENMEPDAFEYKSKLRRIAIIDEAMDRHRREAGAEDAFEASRQEAVQHQKAVRRFEDRARREKLLQARLRAKVDSRSYNADVPSWRQKQRAWKAGKSKKDVKERIRAFESQHKDAHIRIDFMTRVKKLGTTNTDVMATARWIQALNGVMQDYKKGL